MKRKIYLGWVWLNPENGTYTTGSPCPEEGWVERHLVPFRQDAWGWVPCPPWENWDDEEEEAPEAR